jgi:hypothetical protein
MLPPLLTFVNLVLPPPFLAHPNLMVFFEVAILVDLIISVRYPSNLYIIPLRNLSIQVQSDEYHLSLDQRLIKCVFLTPVFFKLGSSIVEHPPRLTMSNHTSSIAF